MNSARMGYETGALAVERLVGRDGVERLIEFYAAITTTRSWEEAFRKIFAVDTVLFYEGSTLP